MDTDNERGPVLADLVGLLKLVNHQPPPDTLLHGIVDSYLKSFNIQRASLHVRSRCGRFLRMAGASGYPTGSTDRYTDIDVSVSLPVTDVLHNHATLVFAPQVLPSLYPILRPPSDDDPPVDLGSEGSEWVFVPVLLQGKVAAVFAFLGPEDLMSKQSNLIAVEGLTNALSWWLQRAWDSNPEGVRSTQVTGTFHMTFTERQLAILKRVAQGKSNPQIARELDCSTSTVKQDLQRAMSALGVDLRTDAATRAKEMGLLDSDQLSQP